MQYELFEKLPTKIQRTLIVSAHVRNNMEDFHVKHLSDAQMKELNPIIRQSIMEGLEIWDKVAYHAYLKVNKNKETKTGKLILSMFQWLILMIPDYWELPIMNRIPRILERKGVKKNE